MGRLIRLLGAPQKEWCVWTLNTVPPLPVILSSTQLGTAATSSRNSFGNPREHHGHSPMARPEVHGRDNYHHLLSSYLRSSFVWAQPFVDPWTDRLFWTVSPRMVSPPAEWPIFSSLPSFSVPISTGTYSGALFGSIRLCPRLLSSPRCLHFSGICGPANFQRPLNSSTCPSWQTHPAGGQPDPPSGPVPEPYTLSGS